MKKKLISIIFALATVFVLLPMSAMADSNEQQIFSYMTKTMGMNTAAACGALANIEHESSFNPNAEVIDSDGLTSYGICQWSGSRLSALKDYCDDNGYDWTTLNGQLHYLQKEFESSESYAFSMISNVTNTEEGAYTAGFNWAKYFERCAETYGGVNQYEQRGQSACNTYWPKYGGGSSSTDDSLSISGYNYPTSVNQGSSYSIYGTVSSGVSNITSLTVGVYSSSGALETGKTVNPNARIYSIANVDTYVKFGTLSAGTHYYRISATNASGTKQLLNKQFTVVAATSTTPVLSVTMTDGVIYLKWNAVDGATKYTVYRSTDGTNFENYGDVTKTNFTNVSVTSGKEYFYKVAAVKSNSTSVYSNVVSAVPLKTPKLNIDASKGYIYLSWSSVAGADKYYVYRSADGANFENYGYVTKTNFSNVSVTNGTRYYYKVQAAKTVDGTEWLGNFSSINSAVILEAPKVSISKSNGVIYLSWDAVAGANKYYVYRSTDGTNFENYGDVTKTNFTNVSVTGGTRYYYKVQAANTVDNNTEYLSSFSAVKSTVPLKTPNVSISSYNGRIYLSWDAVEGANKYYVYRSTDGVNFELYDEDVTKTSFTNVSVTSGTQYYYKVVAVKSSGSVNWLSSFSKAVSAVALKAPSVSITNTSSSIKLSWQAAADDTKYIVYRSTDGINFENYSYTNKTTFTNVSVTAGTTYYYKITAVKTVNGTDCISAYSNTVSVMH